MAVGLEVDADVEGVHGRVVEVLDAGGGADDGQLEDVGDEFAGRAVRVRRLHEADLELAVEARAARHLDEEDGAESGDAVAVEEVEDFLRVRVVVDDAVGVAVERAASFVGAGVRLWWCSLLGFDVVCAALEMCVLVAADNGTRIDLPQS